MVAKPCGNLAASDLWQLPLSVAARNLDYRFFLRTQGEGGADVICYTLP